MTIYRLKTPKEGEIKKEGNYTYKFINGDWREIHYKDNKFESWHEYDNKGNEIHYKNNNGLESWREHDNKGHLIHYKNSNGIERWYDDKGKKITEEEFNRIWEKVE